MSMPLEYFDVHGHLNFPEYDVDREEAIGRAREAGVGMITVGVDLASSKSAVELAERHDGMWASVGLHPTDSKEDFDYDEFKKLAKHPKVVAIGECGLDFHHSRPEDIPRQREIFVVQIALANELDKPLMLHIRNARQGVGSTENGHAYRSAAEILKTSAKVPFNSHFFAGTMEDARRFFDMGGSISLTGVITFTGDYDEIVRYAPIDRVMTETDCPYVAPAPHRGKRNEPVYVIEAAKAIARIRNENEGSVAAQLLENAKKFIKI